MHCGRYIYSVARCTYTAYFVSLTDTHMYINVHYTCSHVIRILINIIIHKFISYFLSPNTFQTSVTAVTSHNNVT